jgi:hypothetical protein
MKSLEMSNLELGNCQGRVLIGGKHNAVRKDWEKKIYVSSHSAQEGRETGGSFYFAPMRRRENAA